MNANSRSESSSSSLHLKIGEHIQLQPIDVETKQRYYVSLIGWSPNESVIVKPPALRNWPIAFHPGNAFQARQFTGNRIYTFTTRVLHILNEPFDYVYLAYPQQVRSMRLRKALRIDVDLEAQVDNHKHSGQKVKVIDMSVVGVGFMAAPDFGELGETLTLGMELEVGGLPSLVSLEGVIKNKQPRGEKGEEPSEVFYGIEFQALGREETLILCSFVYAQLAGQELEDA